MVAPQTSIVDTRAAQMFFALEPAEIERVRRFGTCRMYATGEALANVGEVAQGLTIVISGHVDILQREQSGGHRLIVTHGPGSFMGELAQLAGRPALIDAIAKDEVHALVIPTDRLRALLISEAELGERIMRAFILRRVGLIETGGGGPVIVGRAGNGDVLRLQNFLRRNGHPQQTLDPETDIEARALVEKFRVDPGQLPIVVCPGGQVLHNPSENALARCIGLVGPIDASKVYDVAVVGAGPAGAAAAQALAARGAHVVLLERETLPRYKTCGGGIVGRALQRWTSSITPSVDVACHEVTLHFLDAGLRFDVRRSAPVMHTSMRAAFDAAMVQAAVAAGAKLRTSCAVQRVEPERARVLLHTGDGAIAAGFVIGADGASSRVAASAGWEPIRARAPALEWEVEVEPEELQRFGTTARFDFGPVPGGYAWVFPKRDHLSVGVVRVTPGDAALPLLLQQYLARIGIERIRHIDKHGAWIPLRPRAGGACRGRIWLAGDAAGFADPLLCEGISFAIASGQLAARALLEHRFAPAPAGRAYAAAVRREIEPQLRWGRRLATLLYGHERWRDRLFRRNGAACCEAMVAVVSGERTYASLLGTAASWARLRRAGSSWRAPRLQSSRL